MESESAAAPVSADVPMNPVVQQEPSDVAQDVPMIQEETKNQEPEDIVRELSPEERQAELEKLLSNITSSEDAEAIRAKFVAASTTKAKENSRDDEKVVLLTGGDMDTASETDRKFVTTYKVAAQSQLIKSMLVDDDDDDDLEIPLYNVSSEIFKRVLAFMEFHSKDPMKEIAKPITSNNMADIACPFDVEMVDLDQEPLFKLILAANYLDIPELLDLGICKIATWIKGKTVAEVKAFFKIDHNMTPEEEERVRKDNPWIFDVAPAPEATATAAGTATASGVTVA